MEKQLKVYSLLAPVMGIITNERHPGICSPNEQMILEYGKGDFPESLVYGIKDNSEKWNMTAKTICSNGKTYWNGYLIPQHFYLISDRDIKKSDWKRYNNKIHKRYRQLFKIGIYKRIEASTDTSLGLPIIPESFIKYYVKKNGKIKDIEIEIASNGEVIIDGPTGEVFSLIDYKPKEEGWWNRDEILDILHKANLACYPKKDIVEWFRENY